MDSLEAQIHHLSEVIHQAFAGVTLGSGVSWREADVIDDYGTPDQRKLARNQDEKHNWSKVPDSLVGDLKYQSVLAFLDVEGLRFYLPVCMIYALKNYQTSQSLIVDSIVYRLTSQSDAEALKEVLTNDQKQCVIRFLDLCLKIGDDYFDVYKVESRLQKYWMQV
jgi:hypothetical protein